MRSCVPLKTTQRQTIHNDDDDEDEDEDDENTCDCHIAKESLYLFDCTYPQSFSYIQYIHLSEHHFLFVHLFL